MKSSRRSTSIILFFVLILTAAGFGVRAWEAYNYSRICRTTIGRVAKVEKKRGGGRWVSGDYLLATFSYEIGDNVYRNQQKLDTPLPPGLVTVYYDPADPLKSRLDLPSPSADMLITFAGAAGAIVIGMRVFRKRKGRPTPPRITVSQARD